MNSDSHQVRGSGFPSSELQIRFVRTQVRCTSAMAQLQSREVVAKEMDLNRPISRCAKFGVGRGLSIILWSYCDPLGEIMVAPPLHGEESRTDFQAVAAQLREASRFRRSAGLFASFPLVHPGLSKAHDLSGAYRYQRGDNLQESAGHPWHRVELASGGI